MTAFSTAISSEQAALEEKLLRFADPRFRFEPVEHRYFLGERELVGASAWLDRYKNPFIRENIGPGVAASRGCSLEEVYAEWDRAPIIGTKTHSFIEGHYDYQRQLISSPPELFTGDGEVTLRCLKFLDLAGGRLANYEPVAQELRMFYVPPGWEQDEEFVLEGYCGTADLLARHKPSGKLYLLDWKTSKKIDRQTDKIWGYLKKDFSDLAKHEHNIYSLQISFYRVLLETAGIETAGGAIGWLPTGKTPAELIPAIDYRERVREIIL